MRVLRYNQFRNVEFAAPPDEFAGKSVVYLQRHGATDSDLTNRFCGWTDEPMSDAGRKSIQDAIDTFWVNHAFNQVFTDDLGRTVETAQMLCKLIGTEPIVNPLARTWGVGELAGMEKNQVTLAAKMHWVENPDLIPPGENGEALSQCRRRWLGFFTYVASVTPPGKPSVICCHSSNIKTTSDAFGKRIKVLPSGIIRLVMDPTGTVATTLRIGVGKPEPEEIVEAIEPIK